MFDYLHEFATRVLHVFELLFDKHVALLECFELFERQRVDGAHDAQFALQLAHFQNRGHAVGQFGCRGVDGHLWLDFELASQGVDGGFKSHTHFALFNFHSTVEFAAFFEGFFVGRALFARGIQPTADLAHLGALAGPRLVQFALAGVQHIDDVFHRGEGSSDFEHLLIDALRLAGCVAPRVRVATQTAFDFGHAGTQQIFALL